MVNSIRRNIHSLVSLFVVLGLCAALFHVHTEDISDNSLESPTSHQVSNEHDHCLLCAHTTEGLEPDQTPSFGQVLFFETLEVQELIGTHLDIIACISDRAPPFLA